jgi:predicted DNA-binding transcriptional regulator YafY
MSEPKFKPQYRRLLFIDQALRKGGYPSCATLAAEWQVHPRTIQRDMDYLRDELGAPIAYNASRHGLYYENQSWFLPSVMLTEGDVLALLIGTRVAELYKGTPMAGALKAVYDRLAGLLPEQGHPGAGAGLRALQFPGCPGAPDRPGGVEDAWCAPCCTSGC